MNKSRARSQSLSDTRRRYSSHEDFTRHIDSISPEDARRQALTAASIAFNKLEPSRALRRTRSQRALGTRLAHGSLRTRNTAQQQPPPSKIYTSAAAAESVLSVVLPNTSPRSFSSRRLAASSSFRRLRRSRSLFNHNRPFSSIFTSKSPKRPPPPFSNTRRDDTASGVTSKASDYSYHSQAVNTSAVPGQQPHQKMSHTSLREPTIARDRYPHPDSDAVRYSNTPPETLSISKKSSLGEKVRKVSHSWKSRLKKVFSSHSEAPAELPVQHVDSVRRHFGAHAGSYEADVPFPHDDMLNLSRLRTSSLNTAYSGVDPSFYDNTQPSSSRVTSWANSSVGGTEVRHSLHAQNLTSIQESDQSHIDDLYYANPVDLTAFSQPMRARRSAIGLSGNVDTRRVYSALLRRLEDGATALDNSGAAADTLSETATNIPVPASEIRPDVQAVISPPPSIDAQARHAELRRSESVISQAASMYRSMTPQEVADINENVTPRSRRSLRPTQSVFFPYSAGPKPKSPSPYQIAKGKIADISPTQSGVSLGEGSQATVAAPSEMSASVYSRSTGAESEVSFQDANSQLHDPKVPSIEKTSPVSRRWSLQSVFNRKGPSIRRVSSEDNAILPNKLSSVGMHQRELAEVVGGWEVNPLPSVVTSQASAVQTTVETASYDRRLSSILLEHTISQTSEYEPPVQAVRKPKPSPFDRSRVSLRHKILRSRSTLSMGGSSGNLAATHNLQAREKRVESDDYGKENREGPRIADVHLEQPSPNRLLTQVAHAISDEPRAFI